MVRIAKGDQRAVPLLLERYRKALFAFLYRITVNQADAEDLFQETWMRVVRYGRTFDPQKKFSTWLFQIAVNCTRDFFKQKSPETALENEISVDMDLRGMENQEMVEQIMRKMPLPYREILALRYFHDMKEKEIADLLGIPLGTVKSRLHKTLAHLREIYEVTDLAE